MSPADKAIERKAKDLAKQKAFIQASYLQLLDGRDFAGLKGAAAVFMAGSPGAGKTEVAKELSSSFDPQPVRIDADDFRAQFPGYDGTNSHLFQQAATNMVQKILDRVLHSAKSGAAISFILDGTFSYALVKENLKRALDRGYTIEIYYVYQKPRLAWEFTKAREKQDGRMVPEDTFVHAFIQARENVLMAKRVFGDKVNVSVILKDNDASSSQVFAYLTLEELERTLPPAYNEDNLRKELALPL